MGDEGVGESVGTAEGEIEGWPEGAREGALLGCTLGDPLSTPVGSILGSDDGPMLGGDEGCPVGGTLGSPVGLVDTVGGADEDGEVEGKILGARSIDGTSDACCGGSELGCCDGNCRVGNWLGLKLGSRDGMPARTIAGATLGTLDGTDDGDEEGDIDGSSDGNSDGSSDGSSDGNSDGNSDGSSDGNSDGNFDGCCDGSELGWREGNLLGEVEEGFVIGSAVIAMYWTPETKSAADANTALAKLGNTESQSAVGQFPVMTTKVVNSF
jgi:hypothetical protein